MIFSNLVAAAALVSTLSSAAIQEPSNEDQTSETVIRAPGEIGEDKQAASLRNEELLQAIIGSLEEVTTLTSDFKQTAPSGAVATGKLYLRRPGRARFEYDEPSPILIVATQGNVYVEDRDLDQTDRYPISKTPLRYLLDKKTDLEGVTIVASEVVGDVVAVTLRAEDDETEGELTLVATLPDYKLAAWSILDSQNGTTTVEISNAKYGEKIPNRQFRAPEAGGAFINN